MPAPPAVEEDEKGEREDEEEDEEEEEEATAAAAVDDDEGECLGRRGLDPVSGGDVKLRASAYRRGEAY